MGTVASGKDVSEGEGMTAKHFSFSYHGTLTLTADDFQSAFVAALCQLPDDVRTEDIELQEEWECEKEDKTK